MQQNLCVYVLTAIPFNEVNDRVPNFRKIPTIEQKQNISTYVKITYSLVEFLPSNPNLLYRDEHMLLGLFQLILMRSSHLHKRWVNFFSCLMSSDLSHLSGCTKSSCFRKLNSIFQQEFNQVHTKRDVEVEHPKWSPFRDFSCAKLHSTN